MNVECGRDNFRRDLLASSKELEQMWVACLFYAHITVSKPTVENSGVYCKERNHWKWMELVIHGLICLTSDSERSCTLRWAQFSRHRSRATLPHYNESWLLNIWWCGLAPSRSNETLSRASSIKKRRRGLSHFWRWLDGTTSPLHHGPLLNGKDLLIYDLSTIFLRHKNSPHRGCY